MEAPGKRRFGQSSAEDRVQIVQNAVPHKTRVATDFWVGVFQSYCKNRHGSYFDFDTGAAEELATILEGYYADVRKKDGTEYKKASYGAARSAIQRRLDSSQRHMNIFTDQAFCFANKILDGVLKAKKLAGREPVVEHKPVINEADWNKIQGYFDDVLTTLNPRKLTFFTWFHISAHFCLRGGEVQAKLMKDDLVFERDGNGIECITINKDFMTKNHQGGLTGSETTTTGRIQDPKQVAAIKRYLSKLNPDLDRLFQRAFGGGTTIMEDDAATWFMKAPLSHNMLTSMMKRLSEEVGLSKLYTNHCLRATTISRLKAAGVEDRKICSVSGHKNVQSLHAYDRTTEKEATYMAAAIDGTEPPKKKSFTFVRSPTAGAVVQSTAGTGAAVTVPPSNAKSEPRNEEKDDPSSIFVIRAPGATFQNVTFNVQATNSRPSSFTRNRLSLKLKKKARQPISSDDSDCD